MVKVHGTVLNRLVFTGAFKNKYKFYPGVARIHPVPLISSLYLCTILTIFMPVGLSESGQPTPP